MKHQLKSLVVKSLVGVWIAVILAYPSELSGNCDRSLKAKLSRKTLKAGTILRLKSDFVELRVLENGYTGTQSAPTIKAYFPDIPLNDRVVYQLLPRQELKTLSGVKRRGETRIVEVEIVETGQRAVMYWVDLYNNAVEGSAEPERVDSD